MKKKRNTFFFSYHRAAGRSGKLKQDGSIILTWAHLTRGRGDERPSLLQTKERTEGNAGNWAVDNSRVVVAVGGRDIRPQSLTSTPKNLIKKQRQERLWHHAFLWHRAFLWLRAFLWHRAILAPSIGQWEGRPAFKQMNLKNQRYTSNSKVF